MPAERRTVTAGRLSVRAITLDFGNTLVRVSRDGLRAVVEDTADALLARHLVPDHDWFLRTWAEERERQFREEVPEFREPDIPHRAARVLARARGVQSPPPEARWDDAAAAALVPTDEVAALVEAYSRAFLARIAPVEDAGATLERLAGRGFALAILSNWPLASTIDRFAEAQGWTQHLRAIVVSERVGTIKPHVGIFQAAASALEMTAERAPAILHVGDDWAADVVGASRAGWRTAYLRDRQHDTPLPTSTRADAAGVGPPVVADLEIDELAELDALVDLAAP